MVGGIVAANYGWRVAFFVAGAPGIVLAIWMFWVKEPNSSVQGSSTQDNYAKRANFKATLATIMADASIRHAFFAAALTAIVGYGAISWVSVYLIRSHEMSIAQTGIYLAFVIGILGAFGTWVGGVLADRFGARDKTWSLKFVALVILAVKKFYPQNCNAK